MIEDFLKEVRDIPTLPQVTLELIRQVFEEEPDLRRIGAIIREDPALAAKLLRTVNSAAFGLRVEVTDVPQAISLLGLEKLKATVVTIALSDYFIKSAFCRALNIKDFCMHSLATAVIMREMAVEFRYGGGEHLYLIGILHDLGKVILDSLESFDYRHVLQQMDEGASCVTAERKVYGVDHHRVWLELARAWGFPPVIIELFEGTLEGKCALTTRQYIDAASSIADMLGYRFIPLRAREEKIPSEVLSVLDEGKLLAIGKTIRKQTDSLGRILDLDPPNADQIQQVLLKTTHRLAKTTHQLLATNLKYKKVCDELLIRNEVLEELAHVFTGIIKNLDGGSLAFSVLESIIESFRADAAFIIVRNLDGDFSGYAARNNVTEADDARVERVVLEEAKLSPSMKRCMQGHAPLKVGNPFGEAALSDLVGVMPLVWLAPVHMKDRFAALLGIGVRDKRSRKFASEEFGKILKIVAAEIGLSMENTRLYNRVRKDAITDPLTRISSRRAIMKVLATEFARFKRKSVPLSIALFDLDHFKSVNDNLGHLAGDEFIAKVARLLQEGIRDSDYIGRYGGDEFIAIFPDTDPRDAWTVVERLRVNTLALCSEFEEPEIRKGLSISAGVAGAREELLQADDLIRLADKALYEAKQGGRNLCVVYDDVQHLLDS